MKYNVLTLLIAMLTIACGTAEAKKSSTSCPQKLSGTWSFGQAPYGCGINQSLAQPLEAKYPSLVYDDKKTKAAEAPRFTKEMYDFLTDYATAYLKRRKPEASTQDTANWVQLVLSTANQESFWTHFRKGKDGQFRFFKGDGHHAYGLMQIDDRWHKNFISSKKAYDLGENYVYALDMLYDMRVKVTRKPCSNKTDAQSINRSVYSAYNGGPASKCRWLKPGHKWAQNDKNFLQKYQQRSWESLLR